MKKTKSKFEKIVKILCAMLLAAIQIVGYSFSKQNNWNLVIKFWFMSVFLLYI